MIITRDSIIGANIINYHEITTIEVVLACLLIWNLIITIYLVNWRKR